MIKHKLFYHALRIIQIIIKVVLVEKHIFCGHRNTLNEYRPFHIITSFSSFQNALDCASSKLSKCDILVKLIENNF